jgi:phenylacetate-CoA ligase
MHGIHSLNPGSPARLGSLKAGLQPTAEAIEIAVCHRRHRSGPMNLQSRAFLDAMLRARIRQRRFSGRMIERYRRQLLSRLVQDARQRVPFQSERLRGVDPDDVDLTRIPPTGKEEMMSRFDETIAGRVVSLEEVLRLEDDQSLELAVLKGRYVASKTSGSSGTPSWTVHNTREWALTRGVTFSRIAREWLTLRRLAVSGIRPLRTATIAAAHAHSLTWQATRAIQRSLGAFGKFRFYSILESLDEITGELDAFQPEYVHCYPTCLEMLARRRLSGNGGRFEPALFSVGSEKLTPIAEGLIRRAFPRTELVDHYGLTECLPLSTSCRSGKLHLNSDVAILEPVDVDGWPVPRGEFSDHILVTNLLNRTQPVIRYRVNDSVRFLPEPCRCGSQFPAIEVHSRKGDLIYLRDDAGGWTILSPPIVVDVMLHARGVAQYQVVHRRQNDLLVRCVVEEGSVPSDVAGGLRNQFKTCLGKLNCTVGVTLTIEPMAEIPRTAVGGKLLQMRSLVDPPTESGDQIAA